MISSDCYFGRVSDLITIEMDDKAMKIAALNELVHSLPIENFELLRVLSGHLIRIVENSDVNKMTIKNGKHYFRTFCHF
jgi:RhoGAP domain